MNKKELFWLGSILLLFGILLKLNVHPIIEDTNITFLIACSSIIFEGLIAFGSGLLITFISLFVKTTEKISELTNNGKKEQIIDELLPSDEDEINEYKNSQINQILNIDSEYRTNTLYSANAFFENGDVAIAVTMSYIAHYTSSKREDVMISFDDNDSTIEYIKILNPDNSNDYVIFTKTDLKYKNFDAHGDGNIHQWSCKIPSKFRKLNCLRVEKKYTIQKHKHWSVHGIVFQHLSKGLEYVLNLDEGLTISDISIFEDSNVFHKDKKDNKLRITTNQWLSKFGGISVIISKTT